MQSTKNVSLETFVGDTPEQCKILIFSDADFAGDLQTSKSTSGAFIAIVGRHTFAPINAICKRQAVVSHSSTESEIVALDLALRSEGLSMITFWEIVVNILGPQSCPNPRGGRPLRAWIRGGRPSLTPQTLRQPIQHRRAKPLYPKNITLHIFLRTLGVKFVPNVRW